MKFKSLIILFLLSFVPFSLMAQNDNKNQSDSLNIALALLWNNNFTYLHQNNPEKADSLFKGMHDAVKKFNSKSLYDQGFVEGYQLLLRSFEMQRDGIFIKPENIISNLHALAHGKSVGMDIKGAQQYIADFFNNSKNEIPDTVSIASQEAFLNEQLKRKNVTKTKSGLLFEVLTDGKGESPKSGEKVVIKYTGRLADGTVFDQTKDEPVTFDVDRLVPGFTEGLKLMKVGGKYRMFIPAHLGYGSQSIQGVIPGNSALDFTVELIEIIPTNN